MSNITLVILIGIVTFFVTILKYEILQAGIWHSPIGLKFRDYFMVTYDKGCCGCRTLTFSIFYITLTAKSCRMLTHEELWQEEFNQEEDL